ncbi:MAG: Acyl-CoA synthetase [Caulobacter sp.]|nr:Acyl-CoA synthetase [Caulobacter sp.]
MPSIDSIAAAAPDRPAVICASSGDRLSFREMNELSIRIARMLRDEGLAAGDRVAILLDNVVEYFAIAWAIRRAELRYVPINWHLGSEEAAYLVRDCDARALIASPALATLAQSVAAAMPADMLRLVIRRPIEGFQLLDEAIADQPATAPPNERDGVYMFYSSGTTGHPKGILRPLPNAPFGEMRALEGMVQSLFGFRERMVYFNPAPLYHAAPLGWSMSAQMHGGTVVIAERFDAEATLAAIERHHVTHPHFVPTHFVRMLKLPDGARRRYDLSSLEVVLHAAAPCAIPVKRAMIDWWGPVIHEFYSGSEGGGFTTLGSEEWLAHEGSVGRSIGGPIRIVGDDGTVLAAGETGTIYFEDAEAFAYHKDDAKTAQFFNAHGWGTLGDIGRLDEDGYLYLSDRRSNMIISGGVNIYPQETEDLLISHPKVLDAAVIGVPDEEMGEQVKALVVADPSARGDTDLAAELLAHCRAKLAAYKCPRTLEFVDALPRLPTGKLLKRMLRG